VSLPSAAPTVRQNLFFHNSQNGNRVPVYDLLHLYDLYEDYDKNLYVKYVKYGKNVYEKYVKYVDILHPKPRFLPLSPTGRHGYV
jgi:hypothetical protein